jgi:hypothetical protein
MAHRRQLGPAPVVVAFTSVVLVLPGVVEHGRDQLVDHVLQGERRLGVARQAELRGTRLAGHDCAALAKKHHDVVVGDNRAEPAAHAYSSWSRPKGTQPPVPMTLLRPAEHRRTLHRPSRRVSTGHRLVGQSDRDRIAPSE